MKDKYGILVIRYIDKQTNNVKHDITFYDNLSGANTNKSMYLNSLKTYFSLNNKIDHITANLPYYDKNYVKLEDSKYNIELTTASIDPNKISLPDAKQKRTYIKTTLDEKLRNWSFIDMLKYFEIYNKSNKKE